MESKLDKKVAFSEVELDARVEVVRAKESNLGNFIADVMKFEYNADCAILNGGTIRSDDTYGPGPITIKGNGSIPPILRFFFFPDAKCLDRIVFL